MAYIELDTGAKFTRCACPSFGQPLPLIPSTAKPEPQWRLKLKTIMTIPEAQLFVRRWGRILLPWFHLPEAFAARAMERSFLGICLCILVSPLPAILTFGASGLFHLSRWPLSIIIPASVIMVVSYWLSLRFRAARRLIEVADALHLSGLRNHL
jgi:hypothetical protein